MDKAIDIVRGSEEAVPLLEQIAGKGRGRVFELSIDEIRLGREEDNDIVIDDESVSRLHAKIVKNFDGIFVIKDNQSKNGVLVNEIKVTVHRLNHGDIIQLGHFVFRFRVPGMSSPEISISKEKNKIAPFEVGLSNPNSASKKRLFLWGGVLLVIAVMWIMSDSEKSSEKSEPKKDEPKEETFSPSTVPEFNDKAKINDAQNLADPLNRVEKEITKLENRESSIKESELYFRKGQRDYFNKNYHHAIDNFDTAISLWSKHPLATYYKGLAINAAETEAQKNRDIALKYFNSLQYSRAKYHFKIAVEFLAHVKEDNKAGKKMVEECERYIEFIDRKLRAVEMVP